MPGPLQREPPPVLPFSGLPGRAVPQYPGEQLQAVPDSVVNGREAYAAPRPRVAQEPPELCPVITMFDVPKVVFALLMAALRPAFEISLGG